MTVLGRLLAQRAVTYQDVWGTGGNWSDVVGTSAERHLAVSATLACVDIKSASIMAMPLHEFRDIGGVKERIAKDLVLDDPSELFTPEEWVYACAASLSLWGKAIGLVTSTAANGWPRKVEWLDPDKVQVSKVAGRMEYRIGGDVHQRWPLGPIIHLRRHPLPGGGEHDPRKTLAEVVQLGIEGAKAAVSYYLAGGTPPAVLTSEQALTQQQADDAADRYDRTRSSRGGKPLVLGKGWSFGVLQRDKAVTADLTDIRRQVATEIAVAHGVPPELVGGNSGGSLTYSSLEGLTRHLEVRALLPLYVSMERTFSRTLLPQPRYCRFNSDAIVRTSLGDRMRAHDTAVRVGMASRDERRALEDQGPIPDGTGGEFLWPPYRTALTPAEEAP